MRARTCTRTAFLRAVDERQPLARHQHSQHPAQLAVAEQAATALTTADAAAHAAARWRHCAPVEAAGAAAQHYGTPAQCADVRFELHATRGCIGVDGEQLVDNQV